MHSTEFEAMLKRSISRRAKLDKINFNFFADFSIAHRYSINV